MRFWDTSALVPLIVEEASTDDMAGLIARDPDIVVWYLTGVELASALARRAREMPGEYEDARSLLDAMEAIWMPVNDSRIVAVAKHLIANYRLKAADALQLAAAVWSREVLQLRQVVTLDRELATAARAEGFKVLP